MKSAILHVGPHKTGTTYLQSCFSHHRATLAARGVIVPAAWDHSSDNASHTGLVRAVSSEGDLGEAAAVINGAFAGSGVNQLLVSAEDISTLNTEALFRLRNLFAGFDLTIVYYVRRWSDLLPSVYQEQVKHGETVSFPEFLATRLRNPEGYAFSYEMRLAKLIEVFGRESIRLVSYSALRDNKRDLFVHFAKHFLDWKNAEPPAGALEPNKSLDVFHVELIRRLSSIGPDSKQRLTAPDSLSMISNQTGLTSILKAMEPSKRVLTFNDRSPALHRLHKELRNRLAANVVQPCPADLFFAPRSRDLTYIADDYLMQTGVVEAIRDIYQAFGSET